MTQNITYFGWIGYNNLGDEAIYLANKMLFDGKELIPSDYSNSYDLALFGGGTVVPPAKNVFTHAKRHDRVIGIGVGVKDPQIRNQKFKPIDLAFSLGKVGQNELLRNKFVSYSLRPFTFISDSINTYDHYIHEDSFDRLRDFDRLGVRGPISEQILSKRGISCEVVGDTALVLEPSEYKHSRSDKVAVSMRPGSFKWSNDDHHLDTVLDFCRQRSGDFEFVFAPLNPKDIPFHLEAAETIPNATFCDYSTTNNVYSLLNLYSGCDAVIGERLHASVLSACCFTPFISIEYRTKNRDFAESVNMGDFNRRCDEITRQWLNERLEECVVNDGIQDELEESVNNRRRQLDDFSKQLTN